MVFGPYDERIREMKRIADQLGISTLHEQQVRDLDLARQYARDVEAMQRLNDPLQVTGITAITDLELARLSAASSGAHSLYSGSRAAAGGLGLTEHERMQASASLSGMGGLSASALAAASGITHQLELERSTYGYGGLGGLAAQIEAERVARDIHLNDVIGARGGLSVISAHIEAEMRANQSYLDSVSHTQGGLGAHLASNELERLVRQYTARTPPEFDSYLGSATGWLNGDLWAPSHHSPLYGLEAAKLAAINAMMDGWRHREAYADAFSALATASDAMRATRGALDSYASVIGDVRSLKFGPEFVSNPEVRMRAYRDAGFNTDITKPNQAAVTAMLTLNGFTNPQTWERHGRLIVPPKPRMRQRLKELKPTPLQMKAYRETFALECWLREFIDEQMSFHYGDDWYKSRAPKSLMGRINKKANGTIEVNGMYVLTDADFADYIEIIVKNDQHWNDVFSHVFADREETKKLVEMFKTLRILVSHFKGYSKADLFQLRFCARWFEIRTDGC